MSTNFLSAQTAHKAEMGSFAASPVSVQFGRTLLRPKRLFPLIEQLASPSGFWVSACTGDILVNRVFAAERSA